MLKVDIVLSAQMKKDFLRFMQFVKRGRAVAYINIHIVSGIGFRRCHDHKLPKNGIHATYLFVKS